MPSFVDTNYLNPTSLRPQAGWQPENALAGAVWNQNVDDYRNVFNQQMRMQAIAEEQRRMELEKARKDVPYQDLLRQVQTETAQGQLPNARKLAMETGRTGIAEQRTRQQTEFSQDAIKGKLAEYRKKVDDAAWERMGREQGMAASILENAKALGPVAGLKYVMDQKAAMEKIGLSLPDYIQNPANWPALYDAAVNTVKQKQELDKITKKGELDKEQTRISAGATVRAAELGLEAAKYRADNAPERTSKTVEEELIKLDREFSGITDPNEKDNFVVSRLIPTLDKQRDKEIRDLVAAQVVSEDIGKKMKADKQNYIREKLKTRGIIVNGPIPGYESDSGSTSSNQKQDYKSKYGLN